MENRQADATGSRIDYQLFLDCVHCGLCTAACPTYVELGTEMDSPRGRIYLMRSVTDGRLALDGDVRRHLDLCLDCRACESACPSGVQYGRLIEPFRIDMAERFGGEAASPLPRWLRWVLFHVFPYRHRARMALWPARIAQTLRLDRWMERLGLVRLLPRRLRTMQAMLPRLGQRKPIPTFLPAYGRRRATVALFLGCVADAMFRDINWKTAEVLRYNGCDVWTPAEQVCCGALHYHSGLEAEAKAFAEMNCRVFRPPMPTRSGIDAIVTNVAGCGAMLKDYGHLLKSTETGDAAERFASQVRDVSEFLADLGLEPPRRPLRLKATYHDACHLCHAQQIRQPPRQILDAIPGLELVPLSESELCCGAAGSYNLTQPEMAERLGERKVRNILATGAQAVFTGNAGCLLQIGRFVREQKANVWVAHPIEALWHSYQDADSAVPVPPR